MRETRRNNCRIIIPFFSHLRISIAIIGRRLDSIYSKFCLASSLPPLSFPLFFPSPPARVHTRGNYAFLPTRYHVSTVSSNGEVLRPSPLPATHSLSLLPRTKSGSTFFRFFFLSLSLFLFVQQGSIVNWTINWASASRKS